MIAIRPPEYFPGLSFTALMGAVDDFVLADTFQYSRQSYQNRTKVRNPQGWQWVSIPLKGGQHGLPICEVRIRQVEAWKKKHWKAFAFNYRSTPFFSFYEDVLAQLFMQHWTHLAELTCTTAALIHELLGLSSTLHRASAIEGCPATMQDLVDQTEAQQLLVPQAVVAFDARVNIPLRVLHYEPRPYHQAFDGFEPGMTAFDLLFNYGPEANGILRDGIRLEAYSDGE